MSKYDIGYKEFKECIEFCDKTGTFKFLEKTPHIEPRDRVRKTFNKQFAGKPAFNVKNGAGYLSGSFMGNKYLAHRVVWLMTHKEWPDGDIDHINGDKTDNRPENLRLVTKSQNLRNMRIPSDNKSGYIGVFWVGRINKWTAQIRHNGKAIHLGYFSTLDEAVAARRAANVVCGYHPNHGAR